MQLIFSNLALIFVFWKDDLSVWNSKYISIFRFVWWKGTLNGYTHSDHLSQFSTINFRLLVLPKFSTNLTINCCQILLIPSRGLKIDTVLVGLLTGKLTGYVVVEVHAFVYITKKASGSLFVYSNNEKIYLEPIFN